MSQKFGYPVDFTSNQLLNPVIHNLAGAPSSPKAGQLYYSTASSIMFVYTGSAWRPADAAGLTDGSIAIAALAVNPLLRVNHIGTQPSSTISDLRSTVTSYTLDSFAAAVAAINCGSQRVTNIAQGTNATDATRLDQVQALITAANQGRIDLKDPVRVYAAASGLTLSGLQTIDGVALAAGDRVAVGGMTTQNAIYVAAAGAWTLAPDSMSGSQWAEGTEFLVNEGTVYAGAIFRQTTAGTLVLGTTPLVFTQSFKLNVYSGDGTTTTVTGSVISVNVGAGLSTASGALGIDTTSVVRKFNSTITCDGVSTSYNVVHGLGTTWVTVTVRDAMMNLEMLDNNPINSTSTTVSFGYAPAQGTTYDVLITG
ncbi:hypothetical protein [Beijerinckia sp. L45]|uniref:hypothetical protein n=1 Tax=Beijerinckia sp. L45 TaxID=1641855 RepID=UPI00131CDC3B|nr:hypothetical protein [Beijerinckia sp. L45]